MPWVFVVVVFSEIYVTHIISNLNTNTYILFIFFSNKG